MLSDSHLDFFFPADFTTIIMVMLMTNDSYFVICLYDRGQFDFLNFSVPSLSNNFFFMSTSQVDHQLSFASLHASFLNAFKTLLPEQ
jgi:hypothetical protein